MPIRVAVASDDGESVGWGHFAHNRYFIIYDISNDSIRIVEKRFNPFSVVPDIDARGGGSSTDDEEPINELAKLHGIEKYSTLRKNVLSDVNMIIASGGCPTSIVYFTGEGVRFLFTEPETSADTVIRELAKHVDAFDELPAILTYEDGKLVTEL